MYGHINRIFVQVIMNVVTDDFVYMLI